MSDLITDEAGESKARKRKSKRNDDRWYKRNPQDFFDGTRGLSLEERAVYNDIVDMIYMHGGALTVNDRYIAGVLVIDIRKWKHLKQALIDAGKLFLTADGRLHNKRALDELTARQPRPDRPSTDDRPRPDLGSTSGEPPPGRFKKTNLIKRRRALGATYTRAREEERSEKRDPDKKDSPNGESAGAPPPPSEFDALKAFQAYNELALRIGLPQAAHLTDGRRKAIRARLRECGGADGWRKALAHIEQSAFLQGRNDRNWRADLDFVIRAKSFTKLVEGAYGNGAHASAHPTKSRTMQAFEARMARQQEAAHG